MWQRYYFIIGNGISTYYSPLADGLDTCANVADKKMYSKLPTYRIVVANRCSRNLEPQSHPPVAACMSRAESVRLLQMALPKLGKVYVGL
jgi:hypothetical protein